MTRVPLYLLAGGQSSRFGSDKARATLEGEPLIRRVSRLAALSTSSVTVVANRAGKYADLGLRTIADRRGGLGPLVGLQTALMDLPNGEDWLLLCSCDAAILEPHWLEQLIATRAERFDAIAFQGSDRWQPMPALYCRTALPQIEHQLQEDRRSMQQLLDRLNTAALPQPRDWPERWQVNTPEDLQRHRASPSGDALG